MYVAILKRTETQRTKQTKLNKAKQVTSRYRTNCSFWSCVGGGTIRLASCGVANSEACGLCCVRVSWREV